MPFLSCSNLRPCPHVLGYFLIRNFFFLDTSNVHTHLVNLAAYLDIFFSSALQEYAPCGWGNFESGKKKLRIQK